MPAASTTQHLLARGWKKLTPAQTIILTKGSKTNQRDLRKHDRCAMEVVGSLVYELTTMDGSTFIRRL